ncbi:hypothetical protein VN97_g12363 [Penicillium thymicola]|uniref:Uncharacterized protein n=1 Tax=Penicillium thymicola TaxID=293382 RepID=A0AAI9X2B8_PENTH|nr:hypothetical protein VN97_g12363 [Penicillium thymicola]
MMYMCSEKFTLEGQQLNRLEKPMESESQEALEEDEALRANEEDAAPISDDEGVEETEDVESNIEPEVLYQAEGILAETQQPSMHNQTYDVEDEEQMEEGEVDEDDEADLLPPPITQLGDRNYHIRSPIISYSARSFQPRGKLDDLIHESEALEVQIEDLAGKGNVIKSTVENAATQLQVMLCKPQPR